MVKNCILQSKCGKSTSTIVLKIYKSTTFLPLNSTFYTLFPLQIYIYNDPQNLQIYNNMKILIQKTKLDTLEDHILVADLKLLNIILGLGTDSLPL